MTQKGNRLIWIDCEMTGLDPERDTIIEIGAMVTDGDLKIIAESPAIAIHHSDAVLDGMDSWCVEHHGKSGLTDRCRKSKITLAQAETKTLDFLKKYAEPDSSPMCGNSIGQDRRFLVKYMPKLNNFFHYRNVDVSTLKELVKRWYPDLPNFEKKKRHHVLDDIRESIEELQYYRKSIFR